MTVPITIPEPLTWREIDVPPAIVRICDEYEPTIDAYNVTTSLEELKMLDCYWHQMGYYGKVHPIPVIPYHPIVKEFE